MINLNYFKYFVDAVRLGGVNMAAKNNFVSSPAISQAIRWLEDQYQVELVKHGRNRFQVTKKGQQVFKLATQMIESASDFEEEIKGIVSANEKIKISIQQSLANTFFPSVMSEMKKKHENLDFSIRVGTTFRCKELMERGERNYSISLDNVAFKARFETIHSGKFVFISAKNDKRSIHEAGLILTEDTKEVVELKSAYKKRFKSAPPINTSISSWGVIANMAVSGHGVAYIPEYYLYSLPKDSYRIRKLDVEVAKYKINFYYSDNVELSSLHRELIDQFKKEFKK